jgi:hypothetical protein
MRNIIMTMKDALKSPSTLPWGQIEKITCSEPLTKEAKEIVTMGLANGVKFKGETPEAMYSLDHYVT